MGLYSCKLIQQERIYQDIFRMLLESGEIARDSRPGQFVHLRVAEGEDPLLRRPLSVHRVHRKNGTFELLYRVVGRGTQMMSEAEAGVAFDMMGPLGKGFSIDGDFSQALVVAGGMGSAPVFFLMDELIASGKNVTLLWGAKQADEIFGLPDLESSGVEVMIATEDGSLGLCGLVTELLEQKLGDLNDPNAVRGFVCGPEPMLRCVQDIAKNTSFDWQVSVEERMACGMGVCIGCAVSTTEGYKMVCSDGPVFDLKEVVFHG